MAFANISPTLLDEDLATSDSSKRFLRTCVNDTRKIIPSGSIFQLQQILNISVPKEDRELPRSYHPGTDVLKVVLSDGDFNIYALMYHSSPELSMNTPPGTKIRLIKPVSITHGTFCLSSDVYEVLGGHVPKLVEKWTLQRKFNVKQEWGYNTVGTGGAPMWKPFGYNATAGIDLVALRKMKAMDVVNEQREGAKQGQGKKTEFEEQREQALEEVKDKSLKKNWCPPAKNLMDKELVDLLKEGFPLEEAEEALKKYKNPRKALQYLKDTNKVTKFREEQKSQPREKTKWRSVKTDEEDAEPVPREYQRPTKSISLFGFIEQHIKPETAPTKPGATNDDQGDDYQLALSMSVDSFKREQRTQSRYDGENEFPSLQNKFVKGKSQNDYYSQNPNYENSSNSKYIRNSPKHFNDKQPTVKRDYPSSHKQYESSNRYDTEAKDRQTWQAQDSRRPTSDYNQRDKGSGDYDRTNYNRGSSYGNSESSSHQSYDQNSRYQNRNYGSYKSNDAANSRQNYYNEGGDSKNNDKYQKKKSSQSARTFSYSGDRNTEKQSQPFLEINEFPSKGEGEGGILNQRTYNEFKSGDSRGYEEVRSSEDRQTYSGKGYNNRSYDSRGENSWRKDENRGMNEYREDYSSGFADNRGSSSSGNYKKVDTLHNSFEDSTYRDQSKPNNDYQSRRGGYSRQRRDIPDRNSYQYNRQSDNASDPRQFTPAKSDGVQYRNSYSNTSAPNSARQDPEYSNQSHYPSSGMSSSASYGQNRQVQKGNNDYNGSNYSRQTMVFTRSSNGDNTQPEHQRDVHQVGQRVKNMQLGQNSYEPYKNNYHQKPYNNQY